MNLNKRFWEIDALRGLAVILMIAYHFIFDLSYFGMYNVNLSNGIWFLGRSTAFIFIFLVGISLYLSYSRREIAVSQEKIADNDDILSNLKSNSKSNLKSNSKSNLKSNSKSNLKSNSKPDLKSNLNLNSKFPSEVNSNPSFSIYFKRGLKIFLLGILITVGTFIFLPGDFIVFGILHFIGLAIILEYPFLKCSFIKKGYVNLFLGVIFILLGLILKNFVFNFSELMWLGFIPAGLTTVDYFPLFPWLGVVSLGIFAGGIMYKGYQRSFKIPNISKLFIIRFFSFLGRHSLLIYFIHQPILIVTLYFFGVIDLSFLAPII